MFANIWDYLVDFWDEVSGTTIPSQTVAETHDHRLSYFICAVPILIFVGSFYDRGLWAVLFAIILGSFLAFTIFFMQLLTWDKFHTRATADLKVIKELRSEIAKNNNAQEISSLKENHERILEQRDRLHVLDLKSTDAEHAEELKALKAEHFNDLKAFESKVENLEWAVNRQISEFDLSTLFQAVGLRLESDGATDKISEEDFALVYAEMQRHVPNMDRVEELASVSHEIRRGRGVRTIVKYYSDLVVEAEKNEGLSEDERADIITAYKMARESELEAFHSRG